MKRIDAVVRREAFTKVKKALDSVGCPGMMVFTFSGHGRQRGIVQKHEGRRFKIDLVPKVLLTIFSEDKDHATIVEAIRKAAKTGSIGDGKIFVSPVENAVRIRTGEEGDKAL
jgi:nitrogen regulatory protein P-II 1